MTTIERKTSIGVTIKSADLGTARVRFSTPDGMTPDKDREITGPDAYTEGAQAVVSPWGHRSITDGAPPAGLATVHRNGTADVEFFLDTDAGRETFVSVKRLGPIVQYSYGLRVLEEGTLTATMRAAGATRYLKRLQVLELSPVVEGAGLNTGTLSVKACGCGGGSTCGCASAGPSQAEIATIVAEGKRLLAMHPEDPAELAAKIAAGVEAVQRKYGYWEPIEARVDPELRREGEHYVAWAADRLGVIPPPLKFYGSHTQEAKDLLGFHFRGRCWTFAGNRGDVLRKNCFHETAHYNRWVRGLPQDERLVQCETDALLTLYAKEVVYGRH